MPTIHLATGLAIRDGALLLVASTYPSHERPLWNLPGGRQQPGELLHATLAREVREETGFSASVAELAYVSESYDGPTHIVNATFEVSLSGELSLPGAGDHVVEARWCPLDELESLLDIRVVREPLLNYLRYGRRYLGYTEAGVTVRWPDA